MNQLKKAEQKTANSLIKLSSGLRINKAADDASGLGISEIMRGQIRGLSKASRNIQDGISLVHTTDDGLGQITAQLQRARELSVQASTGTLTSDDRQNIQKEIDQIVQGIDGVANNTEFNTINVLAPSQVPSQSMPMQMSGKVDIVFVVDNTGSMSGLQTSIASNLTGLISSMGTSDFRIGLVSYDDVNGLRKFDFSTNLWATTTPLNEWSQDPGLVSSALTSLVNAGGTENTMQAIGAVASQYTFRSNDAGTQTKNIILLTNEDADDEVGNAPDPTLMSQLTSEGIRVHTVFGMSANDGDNADDIAGLALGTGGTMVDINDPSWDSQLSSLIGTAINQSVNSSVTQDSMPTLLLHVGANAGQTFSVELFDARAIKLGIDPLIIDPQDMAVTAITKVDDAITKVSGQRGKFGAYQNVLEFIASNVGNTGVNLISAESRIRDVDMAKEMTIFQTNNILQQAAQSMLVQANQQPQAILQLLR